MPAFEIECALGCNCDLRRRVQRQQFRALSNASVSHENVFSVVVQYAKWGNWLNNAYITGDQTTEVSAV